MTFNDILTSDQWLTKCRKHEPVLYRELYSEFCLVLLQKRTEIESRIKESKDERGLLAWAYANGTLRLLAKMPNSSFNRFWKYKDHDPLESITLIQEQDEDFLNDELLKLSEKYQDDDGYNMPLMAYDLMSKEGSFEKAHKKSGLPRKDFRELIRRYIHSIQYALF